MQRTPSSAIPQNVKALAWVSFFADVAGEMVYPLLPIFLQSLGATPVTLGWMEGTAETLTAFFKMFSGVWSDRLKRKKPFITVGYLFAGIARPWMAFVSSWSWVMGLRFLDRIGKGVRSAPRDALIADSTSPENRGRSYGLHRSMDHMGGVLGPLFASFLMLQWGLTISEVFFWTWVPGVISVVCVGAFVKEVQAPAEKHITFEWSKVWKFDPPLMHLMGCCFVFALSASSDVFLLLYLSEKGFPKPYLGMLWAAHHAVKVLSTYLGGLQSDKRSKYGLIFSGWVLYTGVYVAFALISSVSILVVVFLVYGMYYGLSEPAERVLVAEIAKPHERGTAYGVLYFLMSLATLPASLLFGWIWQVISPQTAFLLGASLSGLASLLILKKPLRQS